MFFCQIDGDNGAGIAISPTPVLLGVLRVKATAEVSFMREIVAIGEVES